MKKFQEHLLDEEMLEVVFQVSTGHKLHHTPSWSTPEHDPVLKAAHCVRSGNNLRSSWEFYIKRWNFQRKKTTQKYLDTWHCIYQMIQS